MKRTALLLALLFAAPAAIAQDYVSNITYCEVNGLELQMDMASDDAFSNPKPAVILIHRGGWFDGTKELYTNEATILASLGYVAFTISYRLTSLPDEFDDPYAVGAQYPDAPNDVVCALDHILANAETYGVDSSRVAMYGESAGGHLALLTACRDARIAGVVAWSGPTHLSKLYQTSDEADKVVRFMGGTPQQVGPGLYHEASPLTHVSGACPPTLVVQGTADATVPVAQSRLLQQALAPVSPASRFIYIPGGEHGIPGFRSQAFQRSIDYLDSLLAPSEAR
jgi:acetyl esterase/lipase